MDKVRSLVVDLLTKVEQNQAYSTTSLQAAFKKENLSGLDKAFASELFYGTLQRQGQLDLLLQAYLPSKKQAKWFMPLLRLASYQLLFLDRVPAHAVLFEAVEFAKTRGHQGLGKVVNAILRRVQREGQAFLDQKADPNAENYWMRSYSLPDWLGQEFVTALGLQRAQALAESLLQAPHLSVRIQDPKLSQEAMMQILQDQGIQAQASALSPRNLIIQKGDLFASPAFLQGAVTVQDEAASLVGQVAPIEPNQVILDTCSAPGGKTTQYAAYLEGAQGGKVIALDLHASKLHKVLDNARRLGVEDRVEVMAMDARQSRNHFADQSFDKVYVDAPCSGLGLLRRKPEMKYSKQATDAVQLSRIQKNILQAVGPLVKIGGELIYSTCTIHPQENQEVVQAFLADHPEFSLQALDLPQAEGQGMWTVYPDTWHTDGFFIARMVRK